MKILFAQELGGGFGHLSTLLDVAAELKQHDLTLAVPPWSASPQMVAAKLGAGVRQVHAPVMAAPRSLRPRKDPDRTLADALERSGYGLLGPLMANAQAWQALVDELRPDVIVGDFAPSLNLIDRRGAGLVTVGSWYTCPPPGRELPSVKPWEPYVPPQSRRREREMLAVVNAARRKHGLAPAGFFADIFVGDRAFTLTHAAFDAYAKHRTEPVLQPFNLPDIKPGPEFGARTGPAIFCYLSSQMANIDQVLSALNGIALPIQIFARGIDPRYLASQAAPQVAVHQGPADLAAVLPQARLLIHYGAAGMAYAGLLAGTPQMSIGSQIEHEVNGAGVMKLGCGLTAAIAPDAEPANVRAVMMRLLGDTAMQARALALAREMAGRRDARTQRFVAQACEELGARA